MNPNNECKCKKIETLKPRPDCSIHGVTPNPTEESARELIRRETPDTRDLVKKVSSPTTVSEDWRKDFISKFFVYRLDGKRFSDHVGAEKDAVKFIEEVEQKAYERGVDDCARGLHNGRIVLLNNEDIEDDE